MKLCTKCKEEKNISDFSPRSDVCRDCKKKHAAKRTTKWRKENPEKFLQQHRKHRENNKKKLQEYNRKYRKENKEKLQEYFRKYRENNREICRKRSLDCYYRRIGDKQHTEPA